MLLTAHVTREGVHVIISYNSLIQLTLPARRIIGVQFEIISVAQHQLAKVNHNKGSTTTLMTMGLYIWSTQVHHFDDYGGCTQYPVAGS